MTNIKVLKEMEEVMENNENKVDETTPTEKVENKQENSDVKTFTQDEVNEIVAKEKARAKKNSLSEDELKEFKNWQDSKKTEEEKRVEREKEQQKTLSANARLTQENILLKKGVKNDDDIDYIIYKVSKMEGDFTDNVTEYLKNNSRFTESKATGVLPKGNTIEKETGVQAILKAKHPNLF